MGLLLCHVAWVRQDLNYMIKQIHPPHLFYLKLQLKFAGIVYHLWHEDKYMYNKQSNFDYSMRKDEEQPIRCRNGYDKYLKGKIEVTEEGVVIVTADHERIGN